MRHILPIFVALLLVPATWCQDYAAHKKALEKRLPAFAQLCATSTASFYGPDSGRNYAQARYLMLWLQEHGKLRPYYGAFVKNVKKDPTGYATLRAILGVDDMDGWQKQWETWVLGLSR
jgi:hypothetical protein